jgi:hypothetical membrane protein
MKARTRLLFGALAAIVFPFGVAGLAYLLPDYSYVRQTISEIGPMDSPRRAPFAILVCSVAACVLIFASGVRAVSARAGHSTLPAYLIGFVALTEVGLAVFATPHPFHNMIGPTALIGFQAPGALAWAWRKDPEARTLVVSSLILFALLWASHWPILLSYSGRP